MSDISVFWMMIRARDSVLQNRAWPLEIRRATAKTMDRVIVEIKIGQRFDWEAPAMPPDVEVLR